MKVFQTLLESVRTSNPDLMSDEQAAAMTQEFDQEIEQIKADGRQEGQAVGFREGYDEGKKVAADEMKVKVDEIVEKLDEESTQKLQQVLDMVDQANTEKLQQLYDWMKENMVPKAEIETALAAQDEDYAKKFQMALEAVDTKHTKQLQQLYKSIDVKHTQMIQEAVEAVDSRNAKKLEQLSGILKANKAKAIKIATESVLKEYKKKLRKQEVLFEQDLKKEREQKLQILAESVQKYLNYALDNAMPRKQLISEAKYNAAIKTIEKVTDVLKVNKIVQESKEGLFADYEAKISANKTEQEKLMNENIDLKHKLDKAEAQIVLEEKVKGCTPSEAKFVRAYFAKADNAKIIEESIDEAKTAYKKLQSERRESLIAENAKKVNSTPTSVVTEKQIEDTKAAAKARIVSESSAVKSAENAQLDTPVHEDVIDMYAKALSRD